MPTKRSPQDGSFDVWAIGVIPPPATGMTLLTERVVRRLQEVTAITFCNWSAGTSRQGFVPLIRRAVGMLSAVVRLIRVGRRPSGRLYITANSGGALWLTALLVFVGRRLGYRIFLHHHCYSYIDRRDRRMEAIDRWMHDEGVHIVHCRQMIEDFRRTYDTRCSFFTLFPSVVSIPLGQVRSCSHRPFVIGHLSNLTRAKGLDTVIETFRTLKARGLSVELKLAGPVQNSDAQHLLDNIRAEFPGTVQYDGPVYGDEKRRFFDSLDAFLFPTRYKNESWGIVLNEAMAAGAPVITTDRGCTRTVVENAGIIVESDSAFREIAATRIERWIDRGDEYVSASHAALRRAEFLQQEGTKQLDLLAAHITLPPTQPLPLDQSSSDREELKLSSSI
jgi:glycosyltransferase involved in cell wall biosynthesis